VRNQSAQDIGRTAPVDGPFAHLFMAVRAGAIFVSDEGPAMRAHAARIHKKGKSKGKRQRAKGKNAQVPRYHTIKWRR
jgi:hypothetical protein